MAPFIDILGFSVSSYHACLSLAFVVGLALLLNANRRLRQPLSMNWLMIVPLYLASLLGAKLMFLFLPQNASPGARVLSLWKAGYWYHGGLFGGISAYLVYHAAKGNNIIEGLDLAAPFVCLGEAITRVGCFLNGCCYGSVTSLLPGIVFPRGSIIYQQHLREGLITEDAAVSLPIHPVQLYMALALVLMFVLLRLAYQRRAIHGETILLFLISHSLIRFWTEFLRTDILKAGLGLSPTQWLAVLVYLLALSGLVALYRRNRRTATHEECPNGAMLT